MMTQADMTLHDHARVVDLLVCNLEDSPSGPVIFIISQTHPWVIVCENRVNTLAVF